MHAVNARDYSKEQLDAWAPQAIDADTWCAAFQNDYTLVVEADGRIAGFGNLTQTGYFDRLYVDKDHQRQGVATRIADEIEEYARSHKIHEITVDASITAKSFFFKRGYTPIKKNTVVRHGQKLTNYTMKKVF